MINTRFPVNFHAAIIASILILSFISCQKNDQKYKQPSNSEDLAGYVNSYTTGSISKQSSFYIHFNEAIADSSQVGQQVPNEIIQITPKLEGEFVYESPFSIKFTPIQDKVKSGDKYSILLDLDKLIKQVPDSISKVKFDLQFVPQLVMMNNAYLQVDPDYPSQMMIEGDLVVTEYIDEKDLPSLLNINYEKPYQKDIEYTQINQKRINFKIRKIEKSENPQKLTIETLKKIGEKQYSNPFEISVPGKEEFVVASFRLEEDSRNNVLVYFSNPIDQSQDFRTIQNDQIVSCNMSFQAFPTSLMIQLDETCKSTDVNIVLGTQIKALSGKSLSKPFNLKIQDQVNKPEIRFAVKGHGKILPGQSTVILPVEMKGLDAFDIEIFQLFSNNILYNLHINDNYDYYSLRYFGRVVYQKKIDLIKEGALVKDIGWNTYALDLNKLVKTDPGSMYEVRLTFKPEYTRLKCKSSIPQVTNDQDYEQDGESQFKSNWVQWVPYLDGDNLNLNQNDPCSYRYYYSEHYASQLILSSEIALSCKKSSVSGESRAMVTNILSGKPVKGASLIFYDKQLQKLLETTTDEKGEAALQSKFPAAYVFAKYNSNYAYLNFNAQNELSFSEFDVSGIQTKEGLKASIFGERGVWRPGDTVFLNVILSQSDREIPDKFPLTLKLFNPKDQIVFTQVQSKNEMGLYCFKVGTNTQFLTGNYRAVFVSGASIFEKDVRIETIKPNRLKTNWIIPKEFENSLGKNTKVSVESKWLHGSPAASLEANIQAQIRLLSPEFKEYKDYSWLDPEVSKEVKTVDLFTGKLNNQGLAQVDLSPLTTGLHTGILNTWFVTRLFPEGDINTDYFEQNFKWFDEYVGIKIPPSSYGKFLAKDRSHEISAIVVDRNGKPVAGRELSIQVFEVDWNWWYQLGSTDQNPYQSKKTKKLVQSSKLVSDVKGEVHFQFKPSGYAVYYVQVNNLKNLYTTGDFFYTGWSDDGNDTKRNFVNQIHIRTDKEKYQSGEKVSVKLPAAYKSLYHVYTIKQDRILKHEIIEGRSEETDYSFTTDDSMVPNVYLDIQLIQGSENKTNDLPLRMYSVLPIIVESAQKKLHPEITAPEIVKPDQQFAIEISEKEGKEMAYVAYVVDEGLLNLTRFATPDPYSELFAKEALTMQTWDNFDDIMSVNNTGIAQIFSIGGDAGMSADQLSKIQRFKALVQTTGIQKLDKGQKRNHNFTISNYNGEVRVMVMACNIRGAGSSELSIKVRDDLMAQIGFPRVLGLQEEVRVPVTVFSSDPTVKDVNVRLTADGPVKIVGSNSQNLVFSGGGEKTAYFKISTATSSGPLHLVADVSSSKWKTKSSLDIKVENANPISTLTQSFWIEPGQSITKQISSFGEEGKSQKAYLEVSAFHGIPLSAFADRLINYPHGCVEQTSAAGFSQLFLSQMIQLSDQDKKSTVENVNTSIQNLISFQLPNGSFSYWPGSNYSHEWSTTFVGHFLLICKKNGYRVPESMVSNWLKYEASMSKLFKPVKNQYQAYCDIQAYRLYALALAQKTDWAAMNRLKELTAKSKMSSYLLAAAYAVSGKKEISDQILNQAISAKLSTKYNEFSYSSDLRDEAIICLALQECDRKTEAFNALENVGKKINDYEYYSTQEMSFVLLALSHFVKSQDKSFNIAGNWNGEKFEFKGIESAYRKNIHQEQSNTLQFDNKGTFPVMATVVQTGKSLQSRKSESNLIVKLSASYMTSDGKHADLSKLQVGTDLVLSIFISTDGSLGSLDHMALTIPFASGFEIKNSRVNFSDGVSPADYQDIRDDRVLTYFDLPANRVKRIDIPVTAVYEGSFNSPDLVLEHMYLPYIRSISNLGKIKISR